MNRSRDEVPSLSQTARAFGQPMPTRQTVEFSVAEALAHFQADRLAEAETRLRQALATDPNHTDAMHLLGLVAHQAGQYEEASSLIMSAIKLEPKALYYFNLGNVMQSNNRPAAAAECFQQAVAMQPDYIDAHNNLGNALRALKQHEAAVQSFCNVIGLAPEHAQAYNNLANALIELGELDAAVEAYRHAITLRPDFTEPRSNLLFALNYLASTTPHHYLDEAHRFAAQIRTQAKPWKDWLVDCTPRTARPLRVGIVSGDLKRHPVGYFLESIVAELDPARVELIAYPTRTFEDDLTTRIKPHFSAWTSIAGMNDEAAARRVRGDRIDILLDASGHTTYNRLPLFAWKPAPVQASWPGYFASTGLDAIDYFIGDRHVLPVAEESHFVEKPWRLPDCYLCFTPPTEAIEAGPPPQLSTGAVTFGYFGKLGKMTEEVVAVWSRVLLSVPGSRLFLKARELGGDYAMRETAARFAAHGIDGSRLLLEGGSPRDEYLAAYHRVDVMLSPFPYPGGTTTVEALWMGVPVLAMKGDRFLTHICESMLHAAGLADWIAEDIEDYIARAAAVATDTQKLSTLRSGLRGQLLASPLCDARRFARNLEAAFEAMWCIHVSAEQQQR